MTEDEQLAHEESMPRIQAKRDLNQLQWSGLKLKADDLHDLVLRATGSKLAAEEAWKSQVRNELRHGRTPE